MNVSRLSCPEEAIDRPNRRKHILMVSQDGIYPQKLGGMEIRGYELVRTLQSAYDISLLRDASLTFSDGSVLKLDIPVLPLHRERHNAAWLFERVVWLTRTFAGRLVGRNRFRRNLSAFEPDLIYLHKFSSIDPTVLHELLIRGKPVVAWFGNHYGSPLRHLGLSSWAGRLALGVRPMAPDDWGRITLVFNCEFLQRFYAQLFEGFSNQFVIYDGVDIHRFHPASARPASARFVFLGRLAPEKGFLEFCRAMALLPRQLVDSIEVIGDGPMLRPGLDVLRASGRSDLLRSVGPAPHKAVPFRLRRASILVNPSREEGLPASVVEAMACGLAVIATNVGGTAEVVRHGKTGLLAAPGDFTGLVRACRLVAESAELRQRLGWNGHILVSSHFDSAISFATTKALIARAIEHAGSSGSLRRGMRFGAMAEIR